MAKNRRKFTQCPNCGYTFEEVNNFCPNCGQENHDLNVPVKHLIAEFFEGTLHFDTKIWKTLKLLLLKPGLLTEKFNIGQRASYVPPFRLYVFVSLVFFFVLALTTKSPNPDPVITKQNKTTRTILPGVSIGTTIPDTVLTGTDAVQVKTLDSLMQQDEDMKALEASFGGSEFGQEFVAKFNRFISNDQEATQKLMKNTSFMMFLLMPFFALLLHLYYRKLGRNYVEHLMFSIHLHTFYFILIIVAILLDQLLPAVDFGIIIILVMLLYLFLALRQVYKRSLIKTLVSILPISFVYLLTLFIFLMGTLAVSVLMS
ncbi:zinc ribbon domain-containing protein [Pontibacter sp. H259]|uniref:zinc ribbon domain-containing protein n=1 Tax=Pontibacter sp. H259 TaxID=3133421 RepID=UPI0030BFCA3A